VTESSIVGVWGVGAMHAHVVVTSGMSSTTMNMDTTWGGNNYAEFKSSHEFAFVSDNDNILVKAAAKLTKPGKTAGLDTAVGTWSLSGNTLTLLSAEFDRPFAATVSMSGNAMTWTVATNDTIDNGDVTVTMSGESTITLTRR
jgi:hypothetical protein